MSTKTPYFHGSAIKINSDYLMPAEQWNSVQNARVKGAFVTTDSDYAKFFAVTRSIAGRGHIRLDNKKIYLEKLADKIKPHFYLYTVYEDADFPFIHDRGKEYYSEKPIKIAEYKRCDTVREIEKLGYEIYVLDAPFNGKIKNTNSNAERSAYVDKMIESGKYHRVDIAKMPTQNIWQDGVDKIKHNVLIRALIKKIHKQND